MAWVWSYIHTWASVSWFASSFLSQYLCADEAQSTSGDVLLQDNDITVRQKQKV